MPSVRVRLFSTAIKILVRRRDWGDERALTTRARRIFGLRSELLPLYSGGISVERVSGRVSGEWIRTKDKQKSGAILYLHGGGYVACSPQTHRPITSRLAKLTHLPVFAAEYRLAPENRFPAALDDAVVAFRWLTAENGILPEEIAIGGDSAGGGLTISTLVRLRELGHPLPACVFGFSPWVDLSGSSTSAASNDGKCAMFRVENIFDFAAAYLGDTLPTNPLASPLFADLRSLPPLLLHVGSTELLLDDSVRLDKAYRKAGSSSRMEIFDDVPHAWQMLDGFVPEARDSLRKTADFLAEQVDTVS